MVVKLISSPAEYNKAINSGKPALIDFSAEWCGPCKAIAPEVERLSNHTNFGSVEFYKVDIDEESLGGIIAEVGVSAVPTFILFKDGSKVEIDGLQVKEAGSKVQNPLRGADKQALENLIRHGASL